MKIFVKGILKYQLSPISWFKVMKIFVKGILKYQLSPISWFKVMKIFVKGILKYQSPPISWFSSSKRLSVILVLRGFIVKLILDHSSQEYSIEVCGTL